ncbi:urea ABC transporter ATP-binding protein UrtD [Alteribacillus sp. HJP-4]|uniref:urea ABC transporter ATP-binding protein UrtD n=1 Tax=Alteribacillus sp. HJP-4 TaxID=2775394 RepID=UPI0035CCFBCE
MSEPKTKKQEKKTKRILQCEDVLVKFGEFKALDRFSFSVKEREVHFLIGPNGAGKTTFLDVLCGLTKMADGQAVFNGTHHLKRMKEFEIARNGIGRKFQTPSVFPNLSVYQNLEISMNQKKSVFSMLLARLTSTDREKIEGQLQTIGLKDQQHIKASFLSHGQKQWLEIGMVMMQEPELLLLDEPIAGMTEEEEETTGKLLHTLKESCSIIVVEHDMDFVRKYAERVTVMHEGRLLSEGSMEEVQKNKQVREVYLGKTKEEKNAATSSA